MAKSQHLDTQKPEVSAIGIKNGIVSAIGTDEEVKKLADKNTQHD